MRIRLRNGPTVPHLTDGKGRALREGKWISESCICLVVLASGIKFIFFCCYLTHSPPPGIAFSFFDDNYDPVIIYVNYHHLLGRYSNDVLFWLWN